MRNIDNNHSNFCWQKYLMHMHMCATLFPRVIIKLELLPLSVWEIIGGAEYAIPSPSLVLRHKTKRVRRGNVVPRNQFRRAHLLAHTGDGQVKTRPMIKTWPIRRQRSSFIIIIARSVSPQSALAKCENATHPLRRRAQMRAEILGAILRVRVATPRAAIAHQH